MEEMKSQADPLRPPVQPNEPGSILELAIQIAVMAHRGQRDKAGAPYILHPLRVMGRVNTELERIVAVLHDVVEDSEYWTFERLAGIGFDEDVIEPLRLVTKLSDDEDYFEFVKRAATHPVSAAVKRADLLENMDMSRLPEPTEKDLARLEKYKQAIKLLPE